MEWLRPEGVSSKQESLGIPVRANFVIGIDSYMNFRPHRHKTEPEGFCYGCLEQARQITIKSLDVVSEQFDHIEIVFSGRLGFHIHVRDFEVRDWTYYDEWNPLKSHEIARRK